MTKIIGSLLLILLGAFTISGGQHRTENILLVTLDGLRWQEVFRGADPALMAEAGSVRDTNRIRARFGQKTVEERRLALLPFIWGTVARQGQLFGNRDRGSEVSVRNGFKFSYPGYNEILAGRADPRIASNDKMANPNIHVLEWLNKQKSFTGRVVVFGAWDVFPFIVNEPRSGVPVYAGWEAPLPPKPSEREKWLADLAGETTQVFHDVIFDSFVFERAFEYIQRRQPKIIYVAFDETDDWAHAGKYDQTLEAARRTDEFISRLWLMMQKMPSYQGKTTLLLSTDHGRGEGSDWKNHGSKVAGAENIWFGVLGPDTPAKGVRLGHPPLFQDQIAGTVASLFEKDFHQASPESGRPIREIFEK